MAAKVSIILTSYNRPNLVKKSIESVINQTMPDWELFVMDDASNQQTIKMIQSYLHDKRIYYYNSGVKDGDRHKTTRYATLINQAILVAKGKYLCYLTDDTVYLPNRLSVMTAYLEKNPEIEIVYSGQKVQIVNEQLKVVSEKTRNATEILKKAANVVDHCSVMHTRRIADDVFKKYNSYWDDAPDCWHNGDAVFWMRLNELQPFYPIRQILDKTVKTPHCFQLLNQFLPTEIPNGTLVKGLSPEIYLIDQKQRRKLTTQLLIALKYDCKKVVEITDPLLFKYPLGSEIDRAAVSNPQLFPNQRLIKMKNSNHIYYVENNCKRLVEPIAFKRFGFKVSEIITIHPKLLALFKDGPPITATLTSDSLLPDNLLFQVGSSHYFSMENQLRLTDMKIINKLKLTANKIISLSESEAKLLKKGLPLKWDYRK